MLHFCSGVNRENCKIAETAEFALTGGAKLHHPSRMCFNRYFDQLQRAADAAGIELAEACKRAGVAATTLQRWRNGDVAPREATAEEVFRCIQEMRAAAQPEPEEAA